MTLGMKLALCYAAGVLAAPAAYFAGYLPQSRTNRALVTEIETLSNQFSQREGQYTQFVGQLAALAPPKPPPLPEHLKALSEFRAGDVGISELSRDEAAGTLSLGLKGGYEGVMQYLYALQALPFPPRIRSLSLRKDAEGLSGTLSMEVVP